MGGLKIHEGTKFRWGSKIRPYNTKHITNDNNKNK